MWFGIEPLLEPYLKREVDKFFSLCQQECYDEQEKLLNKIVIKRTCLTELIR